MEGGKEGSLEDAFKDKSGQSSREKVEYMRESIPYIPFSTVTKKANVGREYKKNPKQYIAKREEKKTRGKGRSAVENGEQNRWEGRGTMKFSFLCSSVKHRDDEVLNFDGDDLVDGKKNKDVNDQTGVEDGKIWPYTNKRV